MSPLEQRVRRLEQLLEAAGISTDDSHSFDQGDELTEAVKTPAQLRAEGRPYCPKCYTFGSSHRRDCKYAGTGMQHHVKDTKGKQ